MTGLRALPICGWGHGVIRFSRALGVVATALVTTLLGAESAGTQIPDYSTGVKKIFQLGLTDASKAKYVRIETESERPNGGLKMTGNAWLLETKPDGTGVFLVNQVNVVELVPTEVMEQRMKARMEAAKKLKPGQTSDANPGESETEENAAEPMGEARTADWKEADLKADVQSLIEYLNKADKVNKYELAQNATGFFLFAVQVHNRGQSAEANQIISLLFQRMGDSRKVLSAAMSQMADAEYQKVYQDFVKTGNWPQYLSAMESILSRFSTAWHSAPVVERVAGMVRKRVAQKAAPTLTGEGLTEEDAHIASLLGQPDTVVSPLHPVFGGLSWLISDPVSGGPQEQQQKKAPGPLDLIQQRGIKAMPLLAAMLSDEYLIRTRGRTAESYRTFGADDDALSAEEAEQRLESFPRPVSRGEIARRILEPLVIGQDDEGGRRNRLTAEGLAQKSWAWYEQHKTADRAALRHQLLNEGRQEVLDYLLNSQDATDRTAAESYLMDPNKLLENLQFVGQYAQQQGPAARPFIQRYLAELKRQLAAMPKSDNSQTEVELPVQGRAEPVTDAIKVLEDLVSDKTLEQTLEELTGPEKKWNEEEMRKIVPVLFAKLEQEDPDKALTWLLQACLKTKDDQLAIFLVECAGSLRMAQAQRQRSAGTPPTPPRELKIETHADLWKQVLAQKRSAPSPGNLGEETLSFQVQVALAIESCHGNPNELWVGDAIKILGVRLAELIVQRAQARLAGKAAAELPAYPDETKVSKERAAQIGDLLRNSTTEKQHEIVNQLSLDEIVLLPDLVSADPKLNEKLVPGSHLIQNVRLAVKNDALARLCLPLKGKALDRKTLESLIAECRKQAEQGTNVVVLVERSLPLAGVNLSVMAGTSVGGPSGRSAGRRGAGGEASLMAVLQSRGSDPVQAHMHWPIKLATPPQSGAKQAEPAKPADDDLLPGSTRGAPEDEQGMEERFWESFHHLLEPTRSACEPYTCTLAVRGSNPTEEE